MLPSLPTRPPELRPRTGHSVYIGMCSALEDFFASKAGTILLRMASDLCHHDNSFRLITSLRLSRLRPRSGLSMSQAKARFSCLGPVGRTTPGFSMLPRPFFPWLPFVSVLSCFFYFLGFSPGTGFLDIDFEFDRFQQTRSFYIRLQLLLSILKWQRTGHDSVWAFCLTIFMDTSSTL